MTCISLKVLPDETHLTSIRRRPEELHRSFME